MNILKTALVAVILSTISGASLAAQTEGYLTTVQQPSTTSFVTGSTTLVALSTQLSGKTTGVPARAIRTAAYTEPNSLIGTTISYH